MNPLEAALAIPLAAMVAEEETTLSLKGQLKGEVAFVIVKGSIMAQEQKVNAGQMLISKVDDQCEICLDEKTQILLFGGEPLPEERFLSWNFVSHSKDRLKKAKEDWENRHFPKVPDDDTYIPFPRFKTSKNVKFK